MKVFKKQHKMTAILSHRILTKANHVASKPFARLTILVLEEYSVFIRQANKLSTLLIWPAHIILYLVAPWLKCWTGTS